MTNERILRLLIAHLLCALALTSGLAAEKKAAAPPQEGGRFLFVVETSTAMAPFEHAGGQTVFDLIFSGLDGQMQPKDTIGIWTFGEEVHAGLFPMQVWTPEQKARVATEAGMFLKDQHHDRQAHLDRVIRKVLPLVVAVKDVNIFIVSGNEVTWKGT